MPADVGVVVVAAGTGSRAGGATPKQFREIATVPMVLRAIRPFGTHPAVVAIALVVPRAALDRPPEFLDELQGGSLQLVAGGDTRAASVAAGLRALPHDLAVVMVHDAARPFVTGDTIDAVIENARRGYGAIPTVPVRDTLRRWREGGPAPTTVSREDLWHVHTPQAFPADALRALYDQATPEDLESTDDATLWETDGRALRLVPDRTTNIKVTTEDDFALAEAIAALIH